MQDAATASYNTSEAAWTGHTWHALFHGMQSGHKEWTEISCHLVLQGKELSDAVTEGLRSVNLLADKTGDKLVSSYRSVCWHQPAHETSWL